MVPEYDPELFDQDALDLELTDPSEALVLNIVSLRNQSPVDATVNLVGPIIINKRTRRAKQLVVANYSRYSTNYHILEARAAAACA